MENTSVTWLRLWLVAVAVLVIAMVAVGGATRLTDSGLSITEWKPLLGAIPPLTEADWQDAFAKYKQIPEYNLVNQGMSLAGFKAIFWWEWAHRFLGRFIGLVFALPFAVFWMRGAIPKGYHAPLLGILLLGAVQGFLGWYMVKSGLVDRVDVSQYRLALHLAVAFCILGLVVWYAADIGWAAKRHAGVRHADVGRTMPSGAGVWALLIAGLVLVQVVLGAFVAGTKAGLTYNTWPLMDGAWLPSGLYSASPWLTNFTEDHLTIQFNHRIVAYGLIIVALVHALSLRGHGIARAGAWIVFAGLLVQAALGIVTLVSAAGRIPIVLGVGHQTFAAIVFAVAVWHAHKVCRGS